MKNLSLSQRQLLGTAHDIVMAGASVVAAFCLRLGVDGLVTHQHVLLVSVPVYTALAALAFKVSGLNRGLWRYASVADLMAILKATTIASCAFIPAMFHLTRLEDFPRSVLAIQWTLLVMMLGGPRLLYRAWRDQRVLESRGGDAQKHVPVLVLGTGDSAELFIRGTQKDALRKYRVAGLIDDKQRRIGVSIHGVPVLGGTEDLESIVASLREKNQPPQRLVIADGVDASGLADRAERLGLKLSRLPSPAQLKESAGVMELRPIAIEDVLGRPQAPLDFDAISHLIAGQRVLVTGAGGSIGSELVRQIAGFLPSKLVLLDNGEYNLYAIDHEVREESPFLPVASLLADVRDKARIARIFAAEKPQIVFHAAALKHVPIVELNPAEGVLTNVCGTQNVADAALACGAVAMVQISTDKAVNPANVMGACKRLAEYYCQALDLEGAKAVSHRTHFMTVRFGNVMGSSGSVVPLFKKQLEKGGPLTVTHPDIRRYFMTVREAVGLVLQASAHGIAHNAQRGRIFVLDMGEPVKISDIARRMIRLANLEPDRDVKIIYTGLRPGEKLFEELFDAAETPVPTGTPSTLAAIPRPMELMILKRAFDHLAALAQAGDREEILRFLAHIVPGYRPEGLETEKDSHAAAADAHTS